MSTLGSRTVFPLALGANPFGWTTDEATSHAVLDAFVDGGGQVIDTADSYGAGASESIIGTWLAKSGRRDDIVLASKISRHPERRGLAPATIRLAVDEQLTRLQTNHLDLLWAHYDDQDTPLAETLATFDELVKAGKVRQLGISNYEPARITEWVETAAAAGYRAPVALQPEYSLLRRHGFEDERQALAEAYDLAVLPYWGLASGLLTGKYTSADDASGTQREAIVRRYADEGAFAVVDVVRAIAADSDAAPSTVALAWLLGRPGVTAPIASVSSPEQLPALLAVPALQLSIEETARLTAASDVVGQ